MFTLLMSMTYFHPNPKSTSIGARPTARLELVELSSKAMLAGFFVFAKGSPVLRAMITFLNAVAVSVFMIIFIPYYNKAFNIYRFVLLSQVLWGSVVSIIMASMDVKIYDDRARNIVFYFYVAGIPLITFVSYYLYSKYQEYATSYDIAVKNFKVEDTNFNTWEIEEQDKKQNEKRFWHPAQVEIATRFLIHNSSQEALEVADQMFLHGIQKFPNSADLMVSFYKEDSSMASNYLKKASAARPFLDTEFTIYQQEQELRNGARTVGNKKLDAVDRVEFKQLMKKATMYHKEAKASIANFWQTIMLAEEDGAVNTSSLINSVSQMEWSDKNAIAAYRQLLARFPLSVRVLRHYAVFLEEIHNNRDESKKIQRQIKTIQDAGMSDELPSVTAERLAMFSHDSRSKKEKRQYKEYRKQIPKLVTQVLFRKYYDPDAISMEDLSKEDDKLSRKPTQKFAENSDSEEEWGSRKKENDVLNVKAHTGYFKLTKMYINALLFMAGSYTIAMITNYLVGQYPAPASGIMLSGLELQQLVSRVATVVGDLSGFGNSTFSLTSPDRRWVSASAILLEDANSINTAEASILYGNESLGIPLHQLSLPYGVDIFGQMTLEKGADYALVHNQSVYDAVSTILDYLVKTENERTLKLLLMIPVEIVADIDSLRELLHLKRSTVTKIEAVPNNNGQQNPNNINGLVAQFQGMVRSHSNAVDAELSNNSIVMRRAPGAIRSRPIQRATNADTERDT
ncbi:hypothetical protein HDU96_010535 [Phlyctochytrium bullatum]|nr:hypothetical protein HDU96_010535 [Phlyctochytrium bullatum]